MFPTQEPSDSDPFRGRTARTSESQLSHIRTYLRVGVFWHYVVRVPTAIPLGDT